ncbi:MAG TPA: DUF167 domain-containing protein [Gaiellaceae bacterium]|nr:DUF167 domain-containing protein [Gaiellaceae bacterium]
MTLRLVLTVSPGARDSAVVGRHGAGWKVRVAAPPERGRANEGLVELLAAELGVPRSAVRVMAGHRGRRKLVEVEGLTESEAERRLVAAAQRL